MYCSRCGTENEESSSFCKSCGAPLASPAPSPSKRNLLGLWIGVAALVVAIGVGLYFLWPLIFNTQSGLDQALDLARHAPHDSSFFLSLRSSQEKNLAESWEKIQDNPIVAEALEKFPTEELNQNLFSYLKPNLQMSGFIENHDMVFMAMVEALEPAKAQTGLQELEQQAREAGKPFTAREIGGIRVLGREQPDPLYYAMPANVLYLSSSENGLLTLMHRAPGSVLADDLQFKSAVEQLPGETPIFLYLNFAELPDFPKEFESLALSAYEKDGRYSFRLVLSADLAGLLNQLKVAELQAYKSVLQEILTLAPRTDTPFLSAPAETGLALSTSRWLGSFLQALLENESAGTMMLPQFDLSWLNGDIEVFLASSGGTAAVPPLGLSVKLDPGQRSQVEALLSEIGGNFLQPGGDLGPIVEEVEGYAIKSIETPQGSVLYVLGENHLFIALDRATIISLIQIEKGEGEALGQSSEFRTLSQELGGCHLFLYADTKSLQGLMSLVPESAMPIPYSASPAEGRMLMAIEIHEKGIRIEGIFYKP